MIRTIDIDINAADPSQPLAPFKAYLTSPSALRIRNVPRRIGSWEISSVQFTVNYPDNTSRSVVCKLVAGVWVGTVVGSTATGSSTNGFAVTASGTDENGYAVTGYILGKGDVVILATDGTITVGETTYYVHLLDAEPSAPKKGDICKIGGVWKLYTGSAWEAFGGASSEHASSHATGGADPLAPSAIGAQTVANLKTTLTDDSDTYYPSQKAVKTAVDARTMMVPLGGGAWQFVDGEIYGMVVQSGAITYLPASKTAFGEFEYEDDDTLTFVYAANVTSVGLEAFYDCTALTSVSLPAATSISRNAFGSCTALTALSLPSATSILGYAFSSCTALTTVSLPAATSIGERSFFGCTALASLDLSSLPVATVEEKASDWNIRSGCVVTCSDGTYTVP